MLPVLLLRLLPGPDSRDGAPIGAAQSEGPGTLYRDALISAPSPLAFLQTEKEEGAARAPLQARDGALAAQISAANYADRAHRMSSTA